MPWNLCKYIAKRNILILIILILIVSTMMLVFDFIELIRVAHNNDIKLHVLFKLALFKNYFHVEKTLPFIFILTTILTYGSLTKTFELIVARSYGMSVWQFIFPAVIVALGFGLLNLFILNPISSSLLGRYQKIEATHLKGKSSTIAISDNGLWLKETDLNNNIFIHALRISQESQELFDISYFLTDKEYKLVKRIDAEKARLVDDNKWDLTNGKYTNTDYEFINFENCSVPTKISFVQIQDSVISPDTLSIYQLPSFIQATQASGFSTIRHLNYLYKLLASPFFYVSMVLIGIVFAIKLPRTGKFGLYMFLGIVVGFLIYFFADVINAIGVAGNIPITIAAISPTLICMAIGLYLILHYEDG